MPMLSRWGHKDCGSLHILGLLASASRKEHLATSQHIANLSCNVTGTLLGNIETKAKLMQHACLYKSF